MIQANELRIGNLIQNENGLILIVSNIEPGRILADFEDFSYSSEDWPISPIPLDESWLRRAGFARSKKGTFFSGKFVDIELFNGKFYPAIIGIRWDHKIESVHQLQNLFFALTGTELEFSDK